MSEKRSSQEVVDYGRVERAITYLQSNHIHQPELKDVARSIHLSEYHFQRLFSRWAAISPKKFLQYLTVEHAKKVLKESRSLLDATFETGLSSPGRLHDLFVAVEAMTPGEFKNEGSGLTIEYGFHPTPFGECLLAITDRGICGLSFVAKGARADVFSELTRRWTGAHITANQRATRIVADQIFSGRTMGRKKPLPILLKGTNFQIKVWEALLRIPEGSVVSYEDVARSIGNPGASRAVGSAVGSNPVAYIIPCHRVIQRTGVIGGYHWGPVRKQALLGWEWSRNDISASNAA